MTGADVRWGASPPTLIVMLSRNTRRIGVVAWPVAAAAVLFAACGASDDASPSRSTVDLNNGSTAFVVKEPIPTSTGPTVNEDGTTGASQEYEVQAGDYPIKVADQFGIPLPDLVKFNGWASEAEVPLPGSVIKIPPGAVAASAAEEEAEAEAEDAVADEATEPGDTIPEAGDNCAEGSYKIAEGDTTRTKVADKFDVTVDALDAANAATPGYAAFYPGLEIVILAKADC